jgi:hypothetical protein
MQPLTQALVPWHDFYTLLGGASATMVGLLFVAVSVGSGAFSSSRRGPTRLFLSASVVQFVSVLAGCLLVLAPAGQWEVLGACVLLCGGFGLAYCAMAWRDIVRDGVHRKMDWDDKVWYAALPSVCFLAEAAAGALLVREQDCGLAVLAGTIGAQLLVAIHNAWDITVWSLTRRRE